MDGSFIKLLGTEDQMVETILGSPLNMAPEVLDAYVRNVLASTPPEATPLFAWQGGEPTLMGLPFFEKVVELQMKHGRPGAVVANSVQTNGVLVDDALAAHFARYRFLAGCSLDGPADVHDRYRTTAAGGPSHAAAREGIARLEDAGVDHDAGHEHEHDAGVEHDAGADHDAGQ